jgi:hypothetical protein
MLKICLAIFAIVVVGAPSAVNAQNRHGGFGQSGGRVYGGLGASRPHGHYANLHAGHHRGCHYC